MMGRIQTRARVRGAGLVLAVAALSVGFTMPASLTAVAVPPPPDTVVKWNEYAVNALIVTALQPPTVSALHLAMVHGAVYDAVNAIDGGYEPYLVSPKAKKSYSKDAAAATAAYEVLVNIVPTQQPALKTLYDGSLAGIADGAAKTGGIAVGHAAAAAMIKARTGDGRFGTPGFPVGDDPGEWRPTQHRPSQQRPGGLGREGEALPAQEQVAVPHRGTERAHEQAGTRRTSTR